MQNDLIATAQMIAEAAKKFHRFPDALNSKLAAASYDGFSPYMRAEFVTYRKFELRVKIYFDDASIVIANPSELDNDECRDEAWAEFQLLRRAWNKFMCHHD